MTPQEFYKESNLDLDTREEIYKFAEAYASYKSDIPSKDLILEILGELDSAKTKHPGFPTDVVYQVAVMAEESGEVVRAAVQYAMEGGELSEVRSELIQTAAMCIRVINNLPK